MSIAESGRENVSNDEERERLDYSVPNKEHDDQT